MRDMMFGSFQIYKADAANSLVIYKMKKRVDLEFQEKQKWKKVGKMIRVIGIQIIYYLTVFLSSDLLTQEPTWLDHKVHKAIIQNILRTRSFTQKIIILS